MRDVKSFDSNLFTCQDHSLVEALLESAELTPVSLHLVDFTVSVCHASVDPTKNMRFGYVFLSHGSHYLVYFLIYLLF